LDLSTLRRTAAEIAASAVCELFPDVELRGGGETSTGFFYDFYFPHPVHLHLIEEKMRQIVRERRPIRTMEMVAFSALELLKKEGHFHRLEEVEEGLVELIQIGSFHDLCPAPHLKNTAELAAFKIEAEVLSDKGLRITGWCHHSKEELKKFLKVLAHYTEPAKLGEKMGLWKGEVWFAKGLLWKEKLISFFKKEWFEGAFEILGPVEADRLELHRSIGKEKVAEIHRSSSQETLITLSFFNKSELDVISFLQSIGKTLTMLGFDHTSLSKGKEIGYLVEDGIGRSHSVIQVKKISKKGSSTLDVICFAFIEKIFALLLEKNLLVSIENK
jgi:hypothetical protein